MNARQDYIAVFDSGVGGISVLRQLIKLMPGENYVYFGDSANAPYGTRPTEEVRQLTLNAVRMLMEEYPLKALVVACNTATAAAITQLRRMYPELIVIGIEPAVKLAADSFPRGRIGVIATQVTLREEKFDHLMHRFDGACEIVKIPAPGLVELIEAGKGDAPETQEFLKELLAPYVGKLDALVLGCTHYPFVKRNIGRILGPSTRILHGGAGTARETKRRLEIADLDWSGPGQVILRESLGAPRILELAKKMLEG